MQALSLTQATSICSGVLRRVLSCRMLEALCYTQVCMQAGPAGPGADAAGAHRLDRLLYVGVAQDERAPRPRCLAWR